MLVDGPGTVDWYFNDLLIHLYLLKEIFPWT